MANPILPCWEHIPDGEPRLFGDRVYLYGSHDKPRSGSFCDTRLKVWSAPVSDLNRWTCHGDSFHVAADDDHPSSVPWEARELYAPDVVEKDGKYYLFAYLFYSRGAIGVSDKPEGPFRLLGPYHWDESIPVPPDFCNNGVFVDPGVLVDDDGSVWIYCGFEWSYVIRTDPEDITKVLPETYRTDIIPRGTDPADFYEACSPRKIGDTYYLIYSPRRGSRLDYCTAPSPAGPFTYRGTIIDNAVDFPGGNDHGGLCRIGDQWYIFYHRMTNGTCYSRQACVEKINILPDGSIPQVEMTSLGFEESLDPYVIRPAYNACVMTGGAIIREYDPMDIVVSDIRSGSVIGFKYFDFGADYSGTSLNLCVKLRGNGESGLIHVRLDDRAGGDEIAVIPFGGSDAVLTARVRNITGRHAVYFVFEDDRPQTDWAGMTDRRLVSFESFVFMK
ncbi:MAG: family 43 glycosylhydrolase [Clostridia bacterium]|nr:family 43 glycosylhydrolase [Clostridia bacterium]